jgi:hypothetical protein
LSREAPGGAVKVRAAIVGGGAGDGGAGAADASGRATAPVETTAAQSAVAPTQAGVLIIRIVALPLCDAYLLRTIENR